MLEHLKRGVFSFRSLVTGVAIGLVVFFVAIFALGLPSEVRRGEDGQKAIQMLDAMRRPFLKIRYAEARLIESGDVEAATDLTEALESSEAMLERYERLAAYNPEVLRRVAELKEEYGGWILVELNLFSHISNNRKPKSGETVANEHFPRYINDASAGFLKTMEVLGTVEVPIHNDIDVGRRAVRTLLGLSTLLFLYMICLVFYHQRTKMRAHRRSRDDLEEQVAVCEKAEEELNESALLLAEAQKIAHIGHWKLNPETKEIMGSDELFRIFGLGREGATLESFLDVVHPEDRERDLAAITRGIEKGENWNIEHRLVCRDGIEKNVHAVGETRTDETGKTVLLVGTVQDITERKQAEEAVKESEEKLQSILDNSTAVIYMKDLDGRYILVNRWFETLFNVDRVSIKGKTDYDVFPRKMADAFRKNDLEIIKTKAPIEFDEIAPHDDGLYSYISIKFPLFNSIGEIYAVCGISTDITERKKAEEQLQHKSRELEVLTEDLRKLSSLLSKENELSRRKLARILHEQIGQNLAVFNMKFDDITEGIITGETKIKETISNLMPLLENTISSTRELTSDLYPTILDDLGFIPAVTWYKDLVLEPLKIAVLMDVDKSVENLPSDYKLPLFRITQEAFQNISKHARATKVEVKFSTHRRSMKLYIKDNGVGFDLKEMKSKKVKGIGLMLLEERSISLGGSLTIESALGKGTELTIELPINKQ